MNYEWKPGSSYNVSATDSISLNDMRRFLLSKLPILDFVDGGTEIIRGGLTAIQTYCIYDSGILKLHDLRTKRRRFTYMKDVDKIQEGSRRQKIKSEYNGQFEIHSDFESSDPDSCSTIFLLGEKPSDLMRDFFTFATKKIADNNVSIRRVG